MHDVSKPDQGEKRMAFSDAIPKQGPEVFILRMPADRAITFTAWGDKIRGIEVHWVGDRSVPHFEPASECAECLKNMPKRWKGYLHCFAQELRQEVFLEFTPKTAEGFLLQVPNAAHLRGCRFQLKRGKSRNARMAVSILDPVNVQDAIPKAKDPRRSILKLYGYSDAEVTRWIPEEADDTASDSDFR
jgi:hypothetical protein